MVYFDGETYDPERDCARLTGQLKAVWDCLVQGGWWSVAGLRSAGVKGSDAAITARIRDFRKARFGGHTIDTRCVTRGLWLYKLADA